MKPIDRVGAFAGAAYVVLINLAQAAALGVGGSVDAQLEWMRSGAPAVRIGLALALLSEAALMIFVGYLYAKTREAGWPAVTGVIAGTMTIAMSVAAAGTTLALVGLSGTISSSTAQVLSMLEAGTFTVQVFASGMFVLFAAWAAHTAHLLGRTLSYAGIVIGAVTVLDVALTSVDISLDYFAWPFLLVMLWVLVVSVRLGLARSRARIGAALPATASS